MTHHNRVPLPGRSASVTMVAAGGLMSTRNALDKVLFYVWRVEGFRLRAALCLTLIQKSKKPRKIFLSKQKASNMLLSVTTSTIYYPLEMLILVCCSRPKKRNPNSHADSESGHGKIWSSVNLVDPLELNLRPCQTLIHALLHLSRAVLLSFRTEGGTSLLLAKSQPPLLNRPACYPTF